MRIGSKGIGNISRLTIRRIVLVATVLLMGILYWFSEQPLAVGLFDEPYDKIAHASAGGGLAVLLWFGLGKRGWIYSGILVTVVSALEEWHQTLLPGRVSDMADILAASVSAWVLLLCLRFYRGRKHV